MTDTLEHTAKRIADRGRDALLARLRPAFADAARAHADTLQLDSKELEQMVQRAADRADGLQWRRALASVAADELGIGLGEALGHPAVERAQAIVGAPSYEDSLAALEARHEPLVAEDRRQRATRPDAATPPPTGQPEPKPTQPQAPTAQRELSPAQPPAPTARREPSSAQPSAPGAQREPTPAQPPALETEPHLETEPRPRPVSAAAQAQSRPAPTDAKPQPKPNAPTISEPKSEAPTVSEPKSDAPTVSKPQPKPAPPTVATPRPQADTPTVATPRGQADAPAVAGPRPQGDAPTVARPRPQAEGSAVGTPRPQGGAPTVASPRPPAEAPAAATPPTPSPKPDEAARPAGPRAASPPAKEDGPKRVSVPRRPADPEPVRVSAIHLGGVTNLRPGESEIELRLSEHGLDIARHSGEIIGRLGWHEIQGLEVPPPRGLLRLRRAPRAHLVVRAGQGDASFEIPSVYPEELREHLDPILAHHGWSATPR